MYWINCSIIGFAESIGIANPIPSTPVDETFNVFIPITWPWLFTKAPPLFPEFIAASVWINVKVFPSESVTSLFSAEIIPPVTVFCIPKGLPTAIANSPTCTELELPNSAAVRPVLSILITAKSVWESVPTILASYLFSSPFSVTFIEFASPIV